MARLNCHWASLMYPVVLAAMAGVYVAHEPLYHRILYFWGASQKGVVFSDLHAILTQVWCYGHGFDPYTVHADRLECQGFAYSPFLLRLSFILPSPDYRYVLGVINLLTFALAIQFLPLEHRRRDYALIGLALVSAPVIWLLETSNLDLMLFEVALLASFLLCRGPWARGVAYALVILSASLKFYPLVLMGHLLRERFRVLLLALLLGAAGVLVFVLLLYSGVSTTMSNLPRGSYFQYCWGALVLPLGAYYLATGVDLLDVNPAGPHPPLPVLAYLAMGAMTLWAILRALAYARSPSIAEAYTGLDGVRRSLMVSGALVIAGCFFAWGNLPYRQVFFLLVLPGLMAMRDSSGVNPPLARAGAVLIVLLMWTETLRVWLKESLDALGAPEGLEMALRIGFWLVSQMVWWHTVAVLGAVLWLFALSSRSIADLNGLLPGRWRRGGAS
jgi:hypothetical protein